MEARSKITGDQIWIVPSITSFPPPESFHIPYAPPLLFSLEVNLIVAFNKLTKLFWRTGTISVKLKFRMSIFLCWMSKSIETSVTFVVGCKGICSKVLSNDIADKCSKVVSMYSGDFQDKLVSFISQRKMILSFVYKSCKKTVEKYNQSKETYHITKPF